MEDIYSDIISMAKRLKDEAIIYDYYFSSKCPSEGLEPGEKKLPNNPKPNIMFITLVSYDEKKYVVKIVLKNEEPSYYVVVFPKPNEIWSPSIIETDIRQRFCPPLPVPPTEKKATFLYRLLHLFHKN